MSKIATKNAALGWACMGPTSDDWVYILVGQLWSCGIKKTDAKIDLGLKEIALPNVLRVWTLGGRPTRAKRSSAGLARRGWKRQLTKINSRALDYDPALVDSEAEAAVL